jgi:acyl transferase domain-containing protein
MVEFAGAKDATSVEAMFSAAAGATDIPSLLPFERWSIERAYSPDVVVDKTYVRHAGFLQSVQDFDAAAFRSVPPLQDTSTRIHAAMCLCRAKEHVLLLSCS